MIIKEYFVVQVCYVQSDVPYLHFCVLSKLQRHLCDKVCLTVFYKCVYYRVLHKIQLGESAPPAKNLILAFKNTAQTDIAVSGSLSVLATNSVRNLDASVPPKIIIQ